MTHAEVLSPRAHHLPAAALAVVAVPLLAGGAELGGDAGRIGAVVLVQLALAAGWVLAASAGPGTAVIGVAASAGSVAALALPDRPEIGGLLAVLGPALLAVVLDQMLRRERPDLVAALSGGVLLVCTVSAVAVLLLATDTAQTTTALLAAGAALLVGHLVDLVLPRPALAEDVARGVLGLGLAVVAGAAVALARGAGGLDDAPRVALFGGVVAAVAALVAVAASYVVAESGRGESRSSSAGSVLVQGLLPIAAVAPVALGLQAVL